MESIREHVREPRLASPGAGGPGGDNLGSMRENVDRMLTAADRAIERGLSDNSEDFLRYNRQEGGQ